MAIPPPPGPLPAGLAGTATQSPTNLQDLGEVVVEQVPARLAALSRIILLSGTIVPPSPDQPERPPNVVVLRTQVGELVIRTPVPLPPDQILTLQIPPGAPPVRAEIFAAVPLAALHPAPPKSEKLSDRTPAATKPAAPSLTAPSSSAPPPPATAAPARVQSPPVQSPPVAAPAPPLVAAETPPLLPGTVFEAVTLALPDILPTRAPGLAPHAISGTEALVSQLRTALLPAVSLKLEALGEIFRKIPPAILFAPEPAKKSEAQLPLPAAPPRFATQPALLTLPPGARVTLQVERIIPPPADPSTPPSPPPATTSTPLRAASVPTTPAASSLPTAPPLAPPLSEPLSPPPPATPPAAAPASSSPAPIVAKEATIPPPTLLQPEPVTTPTLTAIVTGATPAGEPVATSPAGLLVLKGQAELPVGTTVELSLLAVDEPAGDSASEPLLARHWPVLHEAMALLAQSHPAAHAAINAHLARPEAQLGSTTLFFLAALRLGDLKGWLGDDATRALREVGGETLIQRLTGEFSSARPPEHAASDGWKTFALPLPPEGQLAQLVIHTRREPSPEAPAGETGHHLLVELELSRLGPMQLDGYILRRAFDLTLRSQRTLPASLRDELRGNFHHSLEAAGFHGGLRFETAADLWLRR